MTDDERKELDDLRAWKKSRASSAMDRSFHALDVALSVASTRIDGTLSVRAFRVLADCLIALKDEVDDERRNK